MANRPLTLRLRRVGRERLLRRRAEMRALTRPQGVVGNPVPATGEAIKTTAGTATAATGSNGRTPSGLPMPATATITTTSATGGVLVAGQVRGVPPRSLPPPPPPPPLPSPPPRRRLERQDGFPLGDPRRGGSGDNGISGNAVDNSLDGEGEAGDAAGAMVAVASGGDGGDALSDDKENVGGSSGGVGDGSASATPTASGVMVPVGTATAGAAAEAAVALAGGGAGGSGSGGSAREQVAAAAAAAGLAGNWEAVKWAESCLLTVSLSWSLDLYFALSILVRVKW